MRDRVTCRFLGTIALLLGLALTGLGSNAWAARSDSEIQSEVETVLSMRHPTDTPDWWRALGASAPRVIIRMYDGTSHIFHRIRLVQALGYYDDPAAVEFLKKQAQESEDDVIRNAAIRSVGASQGAKEVDFVAKFLSHSDAQTRLAAAETLRGMSDSRAKSVLDKYLSEEKAPWIKDRLNGSYPSPGKLQQVASSEDRLHPDFAGSFRGFWIMPKEPARASGHSIPGMSSKAALLKLRVMDANHLEGSLTLSDKSGSTQLRVERGNGKGTEFTGSLVVLPKSGADSVTSSGSGVPYGSIRALLTQEKGSTILVVRVPEQAATLVLRREP